MNALQTIDALRGLGVGLRIDSGGQLIVTASRGTIGVDLVADIRANKPTLLAMLTDPVAEVAAIYDAWRADPQPDDAAYAQRYAAAANRAGLPFYDSKSGRDLGAWGWDCFVVQAASEASVT